MPAKSKAQKTAMCMALAARKGDLEVSKLKGAALEIYNSDMTNKEIEEFTVMESLQNYINKNMKSLVEYISESSYTDKYIGYIHVFEKCIETLKNILSRKKLRYNDYTDIRNTLLNLFKYCDKEKLGYTSFVNSRYLKNKKSGIDSWYEVNGRLVLSIFNNEYGYKVGNIYYENFIKDDKYVVGASYNGDGTTEPWSVDVEECIREFLSLYIEEELQKRVDGWKKFVKKFATPDIVKSKKNNKKDPNDPWDIF